MTIRLVLADDDPFIVTSLATILGAQPDIEVAGTAHDADGAVTAWREQRPDIALLDIQMGAVSGLDAARAILAEDPAAKVVFLTTFADDDYIVAALRLGAQGYLIKQEVATIAPALRSVAAGQSVLGAEVIARMEGLVGAAGAPADRTARTARPTAGPLAGLTDREWQIVELVAQGLDNKDIARTVYASEGTVRNHISAILQKLDLKNRTQLAVLYYKA
ncbi:MAG: response regulator transcription factor [Propionibacteriaceae bacterium]|nr:response regulator transcription factor [Propionibacteriaceae bacterium]